VIEFEYGTNGDGYWVYEHMVLQVEDCMDCLTVLYPEHDLVTHLVNILLMTFILVVVVVAVLLPSSASSEHALKL
jgi:hypothetical protein